MEYKLKGFTLIELLIVVAIIAILAAIAVPNFLEAQTRAKVSRTKADMRTIVTGLESYRIDHNTVPFMNISARAIGGYAGPQQRTLERLTSPIAYLNSRSTFNDPFPGKGVYEAANLETQRLEAALPDPESLKEYFYTARGVNPPPTGNGNSENLQWGDGGKPQWYLLESSGPDLMHHYLGNSLNALAANSPANKAFITKIVYDPSNGTISRGSLWRVGGSPSGRGKVAADVINEAN